MTTIEEQVRLYAGAITVEEPDWAARTDLLGHARAHEAGPPRRVNTSEPSERHGSRSAWMVAAAVMILAISAAVFLGTRHEGGRTSPPSTTVSVPTVPVTQPASVYPSSGDWQLVTLGNQGRDPGGWSYQLWVPDEKGQRWALVVYTTPAGAPTEGSERRDVNGRSVVVGDDPTHPSATWEPVPGTTVGLSAPPEVSADDAMDSIDWIIDGLIVDTTDAFHDQVAERVGDALLTLGGTSTALTGLVPTGTADQETFKGANQVVFFPDHAWGDVSLEVAAPATGNLPPGVTAAPIEIRGVTGYEVPPSTETGDRTRLTWSERGYDYSLSFPSSISTSEGVEIAESLHVADRSEVESMLFPDWAPNFATTHGPIESPPSPTLAIDGSSARGAIVTLTVNGLDRYESQQVDLELFSDGPATTLSGGNRIASMGLARSMVDADGQVVVTVALPNALSAADDIVPLDPGGKYLLRVDVPGQSIDLPFPIAAAQVGVPYRVAPSLGADECGGPPVVIAFDGMEWVPDVGSGVKVFGVSGEGQGGFTLTSENSARFETDGGATIDFVPTPNTTVC